MRAFLARRRAPSGTPGATFSTTTDWARPAFTPLQTVPFTTKAGLDAAIAGMQAGDLIQYTGTGVLSISSGSTNGYVIANKNLGSPGAVIDFGTKATTQTTAWGAPTSANYVKFSYTGTGGFNAFWIYNCSNLSLYGGEITSNIAATVETGGAVATNGPLTNVLWYDSVIHDIPSGGFWVNANSTSGTASTINGLTWRGEVYNWAQNPAIDQAHADHGSGMQGAILHGSVGTLKNSTIAIYCHDSLAPGAVGGNGVVQPEGGGGSCIELGQSGGSNSNITLYALGQRNKMIPNGTNPQSTGSQFGGQCIEIFGSDTQNGCVIGWVEALDTTGGCLHASSGGWTNSSPMVTVLHGRGTNTNQSTAGGNIADRYDPRWGIIYQDCT